MPDRGLNFVERCLAGAAQPDDIDDEIGRWHDGAGPPEASLAEYLGFSREEYAAWVEGRRSFEAILDARKAAR